MELRKMDTLKVDTLNVIDIVSLTDEETDREIHQIDINQEIKIPKIVPSSLFSDLDEEDDHIDSLEQQQQQRQTNNKLNRQRTSINQSKAKDVDILLMETSLMIIDPVPPSPPPFSPPLSPNIVTTNVPSTLTLTLPLTSTTTTPTKYPSDSQRQPHSHNQHSHHEHSHHPRSDSLHGNRHKALQQYQKQQSQQQNQPSESEIVLSPAKLGQQ